MFTRLGRLQVLCYIKRMSNKRLVHTVKLRFFEDQANGEWGLAHNETYKENNGGDGFNAFWDGRGLFHDVWEHWFELEHKYFKGHSAMNVGGEMAAMGALWYYYDTLGLHERQFPGNVNYMGDMMRRGTEDLVTEALSEGYCNFGSTLESSVPNQKETDNNELECQLDLYWSNVLKHKVYEHGEVNRDERAKESADIYRKSLSKRKIQNLHRWGYRMAEKLVPHTYANRQTLANFIAFWGDFCKRNKADELKDTFRYLDIKVWKDSEGDISWKGYLIAQQGLGIHKPIEVHKHFSMEDVYALSAELILY